MSAAAEATRRAIALNAPEVLDWVPPKAERGEVVLWYRHGVKGVEPQIAVVSKDRHRAVDIQVFGAAQHRMNNVPHIDDPRLKINTDIRENGAWERSPAMQQLKDVALAAAPFLEKISSIQELVAELKTLPSRVMALQSQLDDLEKVVNDFKSKIQPKKASQKG